MNKAKFPPDPTAPGTKQKPKVCGAYFLADDDQWHNCTLLNCNGRHGWRGVGPYRKDRSDYS